MPLPWPATSSLARRPASPAHRPSSLPTARACPAPSVPTVWRNCSPKPSPDPRCMTAPVLHDPNDTALARTLGHAGLIPFVLLAALLWLVDAALQAWVAIALTAYAALIASFLGGVHWGIGWLSSRQAALAE